MTPPTSYVVRMVLFLAAVAAIAVWQRGHLETAFLANPGLNGVIAAVVLIGAAHSLVQVARLGTDVHWVEAYRRRRGGAVPLPQPRLLVPIAAAFGGREQPVRLSAVTMRALLDGIASRLDETREILRYLVGLAIFLGLLGTFWGLIQTVSSMGGVLGALQVTTDTAKVFQNLKDGLAAPLGGMATSFSSSMFGLAGALIVGFLDLQTGQAQRRFFNELEEWTTTITRHSMGGVPGGDGETSVPAYIQALLEQTAEAIESLQRIVGRTEEGRASANRSLEMLTDRLGVLTEHMRAEQSLLVRLAEQHIETQPLLKRLVESAAGTSDEGMRTSLERIDINVGRMVGELESGRREMLQDLRSEIKLLARTISRVQDEQADTRQRS